MGKKAQEIVKIDVKEIIHLLNKAYVDEWLAYYQYWIAAKVIVGPTRPAVEAELIDHANDELKHATMLAERIIQLGGTPVLNPKDWDKEANCKFTAPTKSDIATVLKQSIGGERCAIKVYDGMLKKLKDKDEVTFQMILDIMTDELEHENDFEMLLADISAK